MAIFTVEAIGGTSADHCKVYDNGNQQCHLYVEIDLDSIIGRPLYPDELDSLKLATYDPSTIYDDLTLPAGMSTSSTQNQFDPHPDNVRRTKGSPEPKGQVFTWNFFVSCTNQVVGAQRLMAVVRIQDDDNPGQYFVYTTHMDLGDGTSFESSVTVTPDPAWIVPASELTEISKQARNSEWYHNHVWELPTPLTILDRQLEISSSWDGNVDDYLFYRDLTTGGINEVHEGSTSTELVGTYHFSDGRHLDFNYTDRQFGAGFIYLKDASLSNDLQRKDEQQKIRLLDNYGTYQSYILDGNSGGVEVR